MDFSRTDDASAEERIQTIGPITTAEMIRIIDADEPRSTFSREDLVVSFSPCEDEPSWWRELAACARVQTTHNGADCWKVALARLVAAGFADMKEESGKYVVRPSARGHYLLNGGPL